MQFRPFASIILTACVVFLGCTHHTKDRCSPALFPYIQYNQKAEFIQLDQISNSNQTGHTAEIFNLRFIPPEGWTYKKVLVNSYQFFSRDGRSFLLSFEKNKSIEDDVEGFHIIGCDQFESDNIETVRSQKDFYTDLYRITSEELSVPLTFWQSYILWSKTKSFGVADAIFHIGGNNLEAFQKNIDPNQMKGSLQCEIVIFPNIISPNYITIASRFTDDSFFQSFMEMLDALNL